MTMRAPDLQVSNSGQFVSFDGIHALESRALARQACAEYSRVTERLGFPHMFKASGDDGKCSAIDYDPGSGLEQGLRIFETFNCACGAPVIADLHRPWKAQPVVTEAQALCDVPNTLALVKLAPVLTQPMALHDLVTGFALVPKH